MSSIYLFPLVLEPQPEGDHTITCPLLPELITEAYDVSQVYLHAADALTALVELWEDKQRSLAGVCWGLLSLADPAMHNWTEAHV
jgi:antitoxin HicB